MAAGPHSATQAPPEKAGFPPFDAQHFPSQLLWLVITFGAIYIFVAKVMAPRVGGTIAARAERISRDLDEAAAAKTQADEATQAYTKSLADARGKAEALARETRSAMNAESEAKRKTIEAELTAKLAVADKEIADRKTAAMANVGAIAKDTASAIVAKLSGAPAAADELAAAFATTQR